MIFKYELGFVMFTLLTGLVFSLLFIVLVGRNFVYGMCKLKSIKKPRKPKSLLCFKLGFPALLETYPTDTVIYHK